MPLPTRVNPARAMTIALALIMSAACAVGGSSASQAGGSQTDGDWPAYGRDPGGERFSPLDGINRENVASLQVAWTFRTGDAYQPPRGRPTAFEATPLYVDGTLYLSTPLGRVIALDPVTGRQRWAFDAKVPRDAGYGDFASRGVSMWQRGRERRIFVATIDARLIALDARTGQPVQGFGDEGIVDLRQGLRIAPAGFADYQVTSPPAVIGNTIVVGSAIQDGATTTEPSGEVRGFDAMTGQLKWSWDPIPQDPSAVGADTWKNGSADAHRRRQCLVGDRGRSRAAISSSCRRAVPAPTTSAASVSATTCSPIRSSRCAPTPACASGTSRRFITISGTTTSRRRRSCSTGARTAARSRRSASRPRRATSSSSIARRATPLIPVEERAVPKSDVPGEEASPTQPFPTAPRSLARTSLNAGRRMGADRRGSRLVSRDREHACAPTASSRRRR